MRHIELFAGCGGMSLGLKACGFELYMANELSPMAGETFAFNLLGENLEEIAKQELSAKKTLWVRSQYDASNLKERLRENPFNFNRGTYEDLKNVRNLRGKLVIGNIDDLLTFLESNTEIVEDICKQDIDLLSGGPPCQGFSLAGKRIKDDHKNLLPLSFAKFAGLVKPKIVLLENVKGITAPFTTEDGVKHYAWLEVSKAFALYGYVPVCMLINSKYFGVPQNRPRFILLGFRKDIFEKLLIKKTKSSISLEILNNSFTFFEKVCYNKANLKNIDTSELNIYDIEKHLKYFNGEILPSVDGLKTFVSSKDAIDDIKFSSKVYKLKALKGKYTSYLNSLFKPNYISKEETLPNHEVRKHSFDVRARFRLYQILSNFNGLTVKATNVISGKTSDEKIIREVFDEFYGKELLFIDGPREIKNYDLFKDYIKVFKSRKQTQRALKEEEPAPAQLTIPDDLCHYSPNEPRTLTVREMARFQSFPDWFVFRSKVTTGGKQRSFEVPQYTQIGNAVPPLLAYKLGITIKEIINLVKND